MSAELVRVERTPGDEWSDLILDPDVLPQTWGTDFSTLLKNVQTAWETMDNPPSSSVASALFELASSDELVIDGRIIRRSPETH
jgi:hypothetical protein